MPAGHASAGGSRTRPDELFPRNEHGAQGSARGRARVAAGSSQGHRGNDRHRAERAAGAHDRRAGGCHCCWCRARRSKGTRAAACCPRSRSASTAGSCATTSRTSSRRFASLRLEHCGEPRGEAPRKFGRISPIRRSKSAANTTTLVPQRYTGASPRASEAPANRVLARLCRHSARGERRDSNPRPPGPQPGALPTELRPPRGAKCSGDGTCRPSLET